MLRGRTDKKFCDDYCRSAYNNKMHPAKADYVRLVNAILRKNRRILEELMVKGEETSKVAKSKLVRKGFDFNFMTNAYTNNDGTVYCFCYEYGYLQLSNGWCYVIRRDTSVTQERKKGL
jgi:hypothetical protein